MFPQTAREGVTRILAELILGAVGAVPVGGDEDKNRLSGAAVSDGILGPSVAHPAAS